VGGVLAIGVCDGDVSVWVGVSEEIKHVRRLVRVRSSDVG
jgi:hypothetical protein